MHSHTRLIAAVAAFLLIFGPGHLAQAQEGNNREGDKTPEQIGGELLLKGASIVKDTYDYYTLVMTILQSDNPNPED